MKFWRMPDEEDKKRFFAVVAYNNEMADLVAGAMATICFVHGVGGYNDDLKDRIPKDLMQNHNIRFVAFEVDPMVDPDKKKKNKFFKTGILDRCHQLEAQFQKKVDEERAQGRDFKCDELIGHSAGGVEARWLQANGMITEPDPDNPGQTRRVPITKRIDHLTTITAPHKGTPAGILGKLAFWDRTLGQTSPKYIQKTFNEPYTKDKKGRLVPNPNYSPLKVPTAFYTVKNNGQVKDCGSASERKRLGILSRVTHMNPETSDLIIPLDSQKLGAKSSLANLGDAEDFGQLNICHSYIDHLYRLTNAPAVPYFFAMHMNRLKGNLSSFAYPKGRPSEEWKLLTNAQGIGFVPKQQEQLALAKYAAAYEASLIADQTALIQQQPFARDDVVNHDNGSAGD